MPQTLRQRQRLPKPKDIALVSRALLAAIPMDLAPEHGWRTSMKQIPNYRVRSSTASQEWSVDIYAGNYYVISVGDRLTDQCKSISTLVGSLCRMLGIRPKGATV